MKKLTTILSLVILIFFKNQIAQSQPICNPTGNLIIYSTDAGGIINIDVDVNIPNLKIGICSFEAAQINITGTYSYNVTQVIYAGYNDISNTCGLGVTATSISGVLSGTAINVSPPVGYTSYHGNGNSSAMRGSFVCDTSTFSGLANNTPDEIVYYFAQQTGGVFRSHNTQNGCWNNATFNVSAGGNCCIVDPISVVLPPICNPAGNLLIYSTDAGGIINIDVDANIPNLIIGICSYEAAQINITGTYSSNVTQVIYAGYDSNNNNCNLGVTTTAISGVTSVTATNFAPPVGYGSHHGNGNSINIIGGYQCDTTVSSGGYNSPDEIVYYFTKATGGIFRSHNIQQGCWNNATFSVSAGGNCCIVNPIVTPTNYYLAVGGNMTNLNDWGTAPNGTGTAPTSFIGPHTWNVHNNTNVTLSANFPVSLNALINIGDGITPIHFLFTSGYAEFGSTIGYYPSINFNSNSVFELDQSYISYSTANTTFFPNSTFICGPNSSQVPGDDYYDLIVGQNGYLIGSTTVQNVLTINPGTIFDLNHTDLTIYGSIANTTGEFRGDDVATLKLNGTGNMGTLRFAAGFEKLAGLNVSIGNAGITPGVIALGSNLVIDALNPYNNLNLLNGGINLNGYNLSSSPTTYYYGGPTSIVYGHPNSILDIQSNSVGGNLNMDATANSLKALILNSGGTLDLGSQLNILDSVKVSNGTLNTNGFLTLKSTANLKARIANSSGGNISGNVTVETFAPGGITDWSVLGVSGVQGQTFNEWYGQIPMTIEGSATGVTSAGGVYFESVQGWDEPSNDYDTTITVTSPITLGKGYWVYLGDNLGSTGDLIWSVTGSPFIGNLTYPVDGALSGYNLVSNPYASPISWAKVLAESNLIIPGGLNDAIYIYNPDWGLTTSYVTGLSSHPNGANDVIPMGQGFYVQSNGYSLLQYTEATKVPNNTNTNPLLRSANSVDPAIGTVLHLKVEGEGYSDYAAIRFHANASTNFDTKLDAHKLYDSPGYAGFPGTWTKRTVIATQTEGVDYSVNSLPYATIQNAVIPVIVRVYTTGQYTISSSDFANLQADGNACVVLKDKLTNTFHDLTTGDYVFSISDTTQAARFELTVCAKESITTSTLTTGINANSGSLANAVFISKDTRGIFASLNFNKPTNATISVTNILGQKIIDSKKVRVTNETVYLDVNTSDQLIFVTVETETEKVTKKFLNFN